MIPGLIRGTVSLLPDFVKAIEGGLYIRIENGLYIRTEKGMSSTKEIQQKI